VTHIFWNGEERTRLWLQLTEHISGHLWHRYSGMVRKGPDCDYNLQNISVVICDTDILEWWGKDQIVITTNRTYQWSFVTQIFWNGEERTQSGPFLTIPEYLCHKWPQICSVSCNHNLVLSSPFQNIYVTNDHWYVLLDQIVIATNRTYLWSLVTQIFWNGEERTRLWLQLTEHINGHLWQIFWNGEERTRLWLQLTEHINGHLWHRYSGMVRKGPDCDYN
jgi:hypothetical protein